MDSPLAVVLVVVATAVLTSLLTVAVLIVAGRRWLLRLLEQRLAAAADEMGERVRQGTLDAGEELLPRFKAEVQAGLGEAAEAVMPRLRSEVEQGVRDGAAAALPQLRTEVGEGVREALLTPAGSRLLGKTQERLVKKGSSVLEAGLSILLGPDEDG